VGHGFRHGEAITAPHVTDHTVDIKQQQGAKREQDELPVAC